MITRGSLRRLSKSIHFPNVRFHHHFSGNIDSIETIGVVGGGQMGFGIALTAALRSHRNVIVMDTNAQGLQKSFDFSKSWLDGQVRKEKLSQEDADNTVSRISLASSLTDLTGVDFVIEAVTEVEQIKTQIFSELSKITRPNVILASNTSSIPITRLGAATDRADQVIGLHFMNPVPVMKLVEIIPGLVTSQDTIDTALDMAHAMGKETSISKDVPGFIANRILVPYIMEAIFVLQEGTASAEDIDKTMKLGTNVPMGPLTLADFIGLDTCLFIAQTLYNGFGDSKYRPPALLERYVEAGRLGKKTGQGFYEYKK